MVNAAAVETKDKKTHEAERLWLICKKAMRDIVS